MAGNTHPGSYSGAWRGSGKPDKKENAQGCAGCLGVVALWLASLGLIVGLAGLFVGRGRQLEETFLQAYRQLAGQLGGWLLPASIGLFAAGSVAVLLPGRSILGVLQGRGEQAGNGQWDTLLRQSRMKTKRAVLALFWAGFILLLSPLLLFPVALSGAGGDMLADACVSLALVGSFVGIVLVVAALLTYTFSAIAVRPRGVSREQVVHEELGRVFSELQYHPRGGLDPRIVQQSRLLPHCSSYSDNDLVRGVYRGIPFQQADVHMSGVMGRQAVQFGGRWMVMQLPKRVSGEFFILYNRFPVTNREHIRQSGMERVELEDTAFHTGFEIWAKNPHDVFYIITPALIERLKSLVGIGDGAPLLHGIAACCQGNLLHFAVNGVGDAFQGIFIGSSGEEETRLRVRRDISLITDLIDTVATDRPHTQ